MAIKIRARGAAAAEPTEAKPTRAKRAAKKPAAKRTASKPAAKAAPKRGPGRPRKTETAAKAAPQRRNKTSDIDPKEEVRLIKYVTKAGERRAAAEDEHKEAVNALHAAAQEALEAGVSMAKVADASGISRQWLYKMGEFADRSTTLRAGGNGSASKPAARAAVKRTPAKRTGRAATKPSAKKSTPRTRIRARS